MVEGSTGADFFFAAFLSVFAVSVEVAGAACAKHRLEATASSIARVSSRNFAIFKCLSL
jgi:hypothetical protein